MRKRVSIIIISDNKLLLVKGSTGFYAEFYFTPGGKVEVGETDIDAVVRECIEELNVTPTNPQLYLTYDTTLQGTDEKQIVNCYTVKVDLSELEFRNEITKSYWYSLSDYQKETPKIADSIFDNLIPALIRDGLM